MNDYTIIEFLDNGHLFEASGEHFNNNNNSSVIIIINL